MDGSELKKQFNKTLRRLNDEYKDHCLENDGHNIQRFFLIKLATLEVAIDEIVRYHSDDKS